VKVRIPKKVRILGCDYRIVRAKCCPWDRRAEGGAFHRKRLQIWLDSTLSALQQHSILLHEVLEIILVELGTVTERGEPTLTLWALDDRAFQLTHEQFRCAVTVLWATLVDNKLFAAL